MKKTGNTRHRIGWRGALILQVEERWAETSGFGEEYAYSRWRDARTEDVTESTNDHR